MKTMKFRILPKVDGFTDEKGVRHKPGEVVELPVTYNGENWLEPAEPVPVEAPKAALEPTEKAPAVPLEAPKSQPTRKRSRS